MKTFITTIISAVLSFSLACSVTYSQTPEGMSDFIKSDQVALKPTGSSGEFLRLTDPPSKLETIFGTPVSISNALSEIDNTTINRYNYKGLEIYFEGNSIFSFKIKSDAVSMYLNGKTAIKTGDHISKLGVLFPNSYSIKKDGQMTVSLQTANRADTNGSISFWYNTDGIITAVVM